MSVLRITLVLGLAMPLAAHAGLGGDELVTLRLEVESLAQTFDEKRTGTTDELAGLRAERAELHRQLRLAKVRNRTLVGLERQDAAADEARQASIDEWNRPARAAVAGVREHVLRGLPFAVTARLEALDRLDAELAGALPDTARVMERLWRLVEEEAAMAHEVTVARQQVELDDGPRLCDVLRIGMALMYVRSDDGRLGWARRADDGWRIEVVEDEAVRAVIAALFVAADDNAIFGPVELLVPTEVPTEGSDAR